MWVISPKKQHALSNNFHTKSNENKGGKPVIVGEFRGQKESCHEFAPI
jgi:hypothetical protein